MKRATFNALPSYNTLETAVSSAGAAVNSYFLLNEDAWQQNNNNVVRVTYYQRIAIIKKNGTFNLNSVYIHKPIPCWDGSTWPSGAGQYPPPSAGQYPLTGTFPDFPKGTSQQTDGYVRIYDILT